MSRAEQSTTLVAGLAHILLAAGFTVAQPLYNLLSLQSEFFVARDAGLADLVVLVLALSFALPLTLSLPALLCYRLAPRLFGPCCAAVVALLFGLLTLIACKQAGGVPDAGALTLGLLVTAVSVFAYLKVGSLRQLLSLASPAVLIFPALFLLSPEVRTAITPGDAAATGGRALSGSSTAETPVIIVVFDELALYPLLKHDGTIDADRYPNFAALSRESAWYRNATTVAPVTNYAVPAIVSARYPSKEALPVASHYPQSLFTALGSSHTMNVWETVTRLCPEQVCSVQATPQTLGGSVSLLQDVALVYAHMVVPESFVYLLPPLGNRWGNFFQSAKKIDVAAEYKRQETRIREAIRESYKEDRMQRFFQFLGSIAPWEAGPPPLHFFHMLFPHTPWTHYDSGTLYYRGKDHRAPGMDKANVRWLEDGELTALAYRRYEMQVALLDSLLGDFITRLRSTGLYDQALLIVTSDHGASFVPGEGYRKLTKHNYHDILPVPLFIRYPGQTVFGVDDSNVELVDILPTIAARLGLQLGTEVAGHAIGSEAMAHRTSKRMYDFYSHWSNNPVDVESTLYTRFLGAAPPGGYTEPPAGSHDGEDAHLARHYGRRIEGFRVESGSHTIHVPTHADFADVRLDSGYVPGFIKGYFNEEFQQQPPDAMLLALNGRVATHAALYTDDRGRLAFSALLPEASFQEGRNALRAFLLRSELDGKWLEELVVD